MDNIKRVPADGITGSLIHCYDNKYRFRVYLEYPGDGEFVDYELLHSDLTVTICDKDATFYTGEFGGKTVAFLDHSPETLGI